MRFFFFDTIFLLKGAPLFEIRPSLNMPWPCCYKVDVNCSRVPQKIIKNDSSNESFLKSVNPDCGPETETRGAKKEIKSELYPPLAQSNYLPASYSETGP